MIIENDKKGYEMIKNEPIKRNQALNVEIEWWV